MCASLGVVCCAQIDSFSKLLRGTSMARSNLCSRLEKLFQVFNILFSLSFFPYALLLL